MHSKLSSPNDLFDVIIIGSGPAGVAAAAVLNEAGLRTRCYDKGALAQAVLQWPVYMTFFSTAEKVELPGFPLILTHDKPTREEYLNYLRRYVVEKKIEVCTGHEVNFVTRQDDGNFRVSGADEWGEPFAALARNVVVATGAYEIPKRLGVPGEDLHKVAHYYQEVHPYVGKQVAVVGGRNGAAEAALLLFRAGAHVTIIYRGPHMRPLKWWLGPDLEQRIKAREIQARFNTDVVEIFPHHIDVRTGDGPVERIDNDFVLAMTGYRPDTSLLRNAGVEVDPETNRPVFNPHSFETNVPGLYVAGVIAAGDISNEIFIENSRDHGAFIRDSILSQQR